MGLPARQVWYCSDTCAKVDWQHHKKMCKYVSGGQGAGTWSATTPAEDCWISNAAMRRGEARLLPINQDPWRPRPACFRLDEQSAAKGRRH